MSKDNLEDYQQPRRERRSVPKIRFSDRLHHSFVYTCIGTSLLGLGVILLLGANYYVNVRPKLKEEVLRRQKELLDEGSPFADNSESLKHY